MMLECDCGLPYGNCPYCNSRVQAEDEHEERSIWPHKVHPQLGPCLEIDSRLVLPLTRSKVSSPGFRKEIKDSQSADQSRDDTEQSPSDTE